MGGEYHADLRALLTGARRVVVLTGAGVSAESGVPTFRDSQTGLWAHYRAQDLATPEAFLRQPDLVWQWYQWRRALIREAAPNGAHLAIARWERRCRHFTLVTQNVDDLHARAGSVRVLRLHGDIFGNKCPLHGPVELDRDDLSQPPDCPKCGNPIRPNVIWFGEMLDADLLDQAIQACRNCEVLVSIGTSALVTPACELPLLARHAGATTLEINPQPTPLSPQMDYSLRGTAAETLPRLLGGD